MHENSSPLHKNETEKPRTISLTNNNECSEAVPTTTWATRGHHCPMLFQYISVFIWHAGKITWQKVFWNFWSPPWFLSITGYIWCFSDYGMVQLSITVFIFDTQHHIRSNTHLTVHLVDFCVCYLHVAATMIAKIFCIYKFLPTSSPCFGFNHP